MRILFISHIADITGAPISLLILLKYFKQHYNWDFRILVRKNGPLMDKYREIAPTDLFLLEKTRSKNIFIRIWFCIKCIVSGSFNQALQYYHTGTDVLLENRKQKEHFKILKASFHEWQPDIIYSNTAMNGDCLEVLDLDAPVIVHVRELERTLKQLKGIRLKAFYERTNLYIAVSQAVKEHLITAHNIKKSKIKIAHAAIENDIIHEKAVAISEKEIRSELETNYSTMIIGGVGFVGLRKGVDIFVDVAKNVVSRLNRKKSILFVWVGEGAEMDMIRNKIKEYNIHSHVKFIGLKTNPYPYMKMFDLVLMTSRDDPFPRVNIEAGAFGKPVIAFTESGGSKEYIQGGCGILVDDFNVQQMADRVIELMENEKLRINMGQNAKEKVLSHYDVSIVAPIIAQNIEDLISLTK
jgi:glycosyltransferase involved in cell wall biosynthesis